MVIHVRIMSVTMVVHARVRTESQHVYVQQALKETLARQVVYHYIEKFRSFMVKFPSMYLNFTK